MFSDEYSRLPLTVNNAADENSEPVGKPMGGKSEFLLFLPFMLFPETHFYLLLSLRVLERGWGAKRITGSCLYHIYFVC